MFRGEKPGLAGPARRARAGGDTAQRQDVADGFVQALLEEARQAGALDGIGELGIKRIDVDRQLAFLPQIVEDVLVCRDGESSVHLETAREGFQELPRVLRSVMVVFAVLGDEVGILPDGNPILAPVATECPARQRLAGIPLPLSEMPFGSIVVVERNESRLPTHGEPHVSGAQIGIHLVAQFFDGMPLLGGIWLGDARRLVNPLDGHLVSEFGIAGVEQAGDRRGAGSVRRAGERDVALAGQQPGGGIESDPAGAGKVRFGPGMQVGEIGSGARRSVERLHVRHELNQIAGNEARGQPEVAHDLDQQPGRIAAGAAAQRESFLASLHARFHTNDVADFVLHELIEADQKIHGAGGCARHAGEKGGKPRAGRLGFEKRAQLAGGQGVVGKRALFRVRLQEKVERIVDRHFGNQIDFHE